MRTRALIGIAALLIAALACLSFFSHWPVHSSALPDDAASRQPVIVELFTSEGCSSCPPADSLLAKLAQDQPFEGIEILPLEEHVDYWNSLGWTDPFSSVDFSRRQEQYAVVLPDGGVYTPQMIVDGRAQFIGNRTHEARDQIRWAASHPKARLLLTPLPPQNTRTRSFELRLDNSQPSRAGILPTFGSAPVNSTTLDLWIALTEKNLRSKVSSGENSGATLQHAPVVRLLHKLQSPSKPLNAPIQFSLDLDEHWVPANLTVIAFLANPQSHQITAAGSVPVAP
jgi:hypothetical protein